MKKAAVIVAVIIIASLPAFSETTPQKIDSKGIWIWGSTLYDVGISRFVSEMEKHNFSDVYLLIKDASGYYTFDLLEALLNSSAKLRIHAWIICFYDESHGGWIDPNSSEYREYLINDIIIPAVEKGADGICLDYIRYPGNAHGDTYPITSFCREVKKIVKGINPHCAVSAAVMPEMDANAFYYGQSYEEMGKYVDCLLPMTYTHAYKMPPSWVGEVVSYIKKRVSCKVEAIIESTDENGIYMDKDELKRCIDAALNSGSDGISFFRYPIAEWQYSVIDLYNPFFDDKPPEINISYPEKNWFYLFGKKLLPCENLTVVIGYPRKIIVNARDESGIKMVKLFANDMLIGTAYNEPYEFNFEYRGFYKIKAVAIDNYDNIAFDTMDFFML